MALGDQQKREMLNGWISAIEQQLYGRQLDQAMWEQVDPTAIQAKTVAPELAAQMVSQVEAEKRNELARASWDIEKLTLRLKLFNEELATLSPKAGGETAAAN